MEDNVQGTDAVDAAAEESGTSEATSNSQDTQTARYSAEAAKWRVKFREAEKQLAELRSEAEEAKSGNSDPDSKAELARLKRDFAEMQSRSKQFEEKAQKKTLSAALSGIAARTTDSESAEALLSMRAKVADDDKVVFVIKDEDGEEREIEATFENVRKHGILKPIFFPSEGVAGVGSTGTARKAGTAGIDLERAKTDQKYFEDNKDAIRAARRAQQS